MLLKNIETEKLPAWGTALKKEKPQRSGRGTWQLKNSNGTFCQGIKMLCLEAQKESGAGDRKDFGRVEASLYYCLIKACLLAILRKQMTA